MLELKKESGYEFSKRMREAQKAKKRVEIAKDVIARLESKEIVATKGIYSPYVEEQLKTMVLDSPNKKLSLREAFNKVKPKTCNVCALGSLFISTLDKFNKCEITENFELLRPRAGLRENVFGNLLTRYFEPCQLDLMETAFEGHSINSYGTNYITPHSTILNAIQWLDIYPDADYRLKQIMRNLIYNKGTFIP